MSTSSRDQVYVDRLIVGRPVEVANALRTAARQGRLIAATAARSLPDDPSRVAVKARMVTLASCRPAATAVVSSPWLVRHGMIRRVAAVSVAVAGAGVGVAVIGYAAGLLVSAVWPLLLAIAALLFALRRVLRRAGERCLGLHCPGCRH